MGRLTTRKPARRVTLDADGVTVSIRAETVTVEEPLQVRVDGEPLTVTMRTPGADFDLTLGFLITEGLVTGAHDVVTLMHCQDVDANNSPTYNAVDVRLRTGAQIDTRPAARAFAATSSCGVCGKVSIDTVRTCSAYDLSQDRTVLDPATLLAMPAALRQQQKVFDRTGGLHAAGLFTADGELLVAREDVGRHNAVDKVIGWAARENRLPLTAHVLVVSSRASFELTQKAVMAGIPCLAAVSAPSSLAVGLAEEAGLTLIGFLRPPRLTVYSGHARMGI